MTRTIRKLHKNSSRLIAIRARILNPNSWSLYAVLDAFVEKLELRITAVEERVTSQEKTVEGVIESVDFDAEKLTNTEHSLERLEKSLAEATREIANSRITVAKLSDTVSRQERHSRSFNIRVLGVREENTENCINILERIIGERFDITGSTIENAHRTGKPAPDRPRHIIARFYSRAVRASVSVSDCYCIPQCVRLIAGDWCLHVVD